MRGTHTGRKMGEDCRDCGKWEEAMYWTHFHSTMFCQILSPGFHQQLAIPKKFANNMKQKILENGTLTGPSGAKWNVGLVPSEDTMLFKHGWKEFVADHSLKEDDVLIFKYNGDSRFDVLIFNGQSLCERETSYFVRKCEHKPDNGFHTKRNTRESSVDVGHDDSSDFVLGDTSSKRLRKDEKLMPVHSGRSPQANGRTRKGANHIRRDQAKHAVVQKVNTSGAKKVSVPAYPLQYVSSRRHVTEEEKEHALQMAHEASTEHSFIIVLPSTSVYKGFYLSIPSEWLTSHLPRKSQEVILRVKENGCVKEKTWKARFVIQRIRYGGLIGGWRDFAFANNLEEADACLFELASRTNDAITMDVSIFRVVKEVSPLTRMTIPPISRRGKRAKYPRRK